MPSRFWRNWGRSYWMIPFPIANFAQQFLRGLQVTPRQACRWVPHLRAGNEGSHLGLVHHWYGYTCKYSPVFIERTPFQFAEQSPIGRAVLYMKELNRDQQRKFTPEAPIDFLPRRWVKHVLRKDSSGTLVASRPHYEPALLTTLNERLKSGDVTVSHSRRWSDFEEHLIPRLSLARIAAAKLQVLTNPFQMIKSRFFVLRVVVNRHW